MSRSVDQRLGIELTSMLLQYVALAGWNASQLREPRGAPLVINISPHCAAS